MTDVPIIDELVAKLPDFADLKAAKIRFDQLFEERRQQQRAKLEHDAQQIDCEIVPNGNDKPKKRGRKPKENVA